MVLEAIFYRRLMPASVDPTTFKNSDFGRAKRKLSQPLGGRAETQQFREVQASAAVAAIDDAQGKIGQNGAKMS